MNKLFLVSNGLVEGRDGLLLHPALTDWAKQLAAMKRQWFHCREKNPLAWYAHVAGVEPALLLAARAADLPANTRQCWVASPYHAQLGRDKVRLLEEGALAWTAEDAAWICDLLNPLLQEEGMLLCRTGDALLLACSEPMQAEPVSFAEIAGRSLPDRLPLGADGGRLTRLLSEIQMSLHGRPSETRDARGEPGINGLWLWGPCSWPASINERVLPVATRNPFLYAVAEGREAQLIISEAERLAELVRADVRLPKRVVLAGGGHAVMLEKSFMPKRSQKGWQPVSPKAEEALMPLLRE